jgi:tetratricopeptide (TPR) repeat protein
MADIFSQAMEFRTSGSEAQAMEAFESVIQLKPECWQAHYLLGLDLAARENIEEARVQLLAATRYRPDFAPAHLNLGLMLVKLHRLDQALAEFGITLQIDPTNQVAQEYIGTFHASK